VTYTLFDLTYRVARELDILTEGNTTGYGSSSFEDTNDRTEDNDFWNGGTVWVVRHLTALGTPPEGQFGVVTDSTSAGLITFRPAMSSFIHVGDKYAIANKRIPLHVIISQINAALLDMGIVPYTDITSVTIANNKTEYTLPLAAKRDLRQVWVQTDKNNVVANTWVEVLNWYAQSVDPGAPDTLILPAQFDTGYMLKLVYMAPHPELHLYGDLLSEHIPLERVIYPAVHGCLKWRKERTGWKDWDSQITRWDAKAQEAKSMFRIPNAPRKPNHVFLASSGTANRDDTVNKVYL
jgi:hypothetical protein